MATVYPQLAQDPLPPGWECKYDPRIGRYYFVNHKEHSTTWEDPRLKHPQIQQAYSPYSSNNVTPTPLHPSSVLQLQGNQANSYSSPSVGRHHVTSQGNATPSYGSPSLARQASPLGNSTTSSSASRPSSTAPHEGGTVPVDDKILSKLCLQFPTVDETHIWQLLKQYHNRENVVVSALLAEGHPRAQTHLIEHENLTPKLQRHGEPEELPPADETSVQKLRSFFPSIDLDLIKALLRHCDNNAQDASTRLVSMGYNKRDTPITRPNAQRQEIARPVLPERPAFVAPPTPADRETLIKKLHEQFPAVSRTLISMAIETGKYDEGRAKQFLTAMTPQDGTKRPIPSLGAEDKTDGQAIHEATTTTTTTNASKVNAHSQTFMTSKTDGVAPQVEEEKPLSSIKSPRDSPAKIISTDVISVAKAPPSPQHKSRFRFKFRRDKKKANKATSTNEEQDSSKNNNNNKTKAKGPDPNLRKGPFSGFLLKNYFPWFGSNSKNRKGPDPSFRKGPDPNNIGARSESRAKGPAQRPRGPLADITQHEIIVESG